MAEDPETSNELIAQLFDKRTIHVAIRPVERIKLPEKIRAFPIISAVGLAVYLIGIIPGNDSQDIPQTKRTPRSEQMELFRTPRTPLG
ncbi:MAG: hypothetical protein Q9173_003176 [Seirophora scorigena]